MKNIIFFLLLSTISFAQTKGHVLQDASGFATNAAINIDAESMSGAGTSASALFAKNFFNANLTANANHTHAAANKITTINNLGGWTMRSGIVANTTFTMDSTAASIIGTQITLSQGVGVNPRIWLDGASDRIYFTSSAGRFRMETPPTYADDTAAGVGGLSAGDIYKTSSGVLMIKL